jgi:hypothetical protein
LIDGLESTPYLKNNKRTDVTGADHNQTSEISKDEIELFGAASETKNGGLKRLELEF